MGYRITQIPKKRGFRKIYIPDDETKMELTILLDTLRKQKISKHAHGFIKRRNIITNAEQHKGKYCTITLDLKDFFDTCTLEKAQSKRLPREVLSKCFPDGAARQGLPTSPYIANILFSDVDKAIIKTLIKIDAKAVYTRYADDIAISTDLSERLYIKKIITDVIGTIHRCGFKVNMRKIRVMRQTSRYLPRCYRARNGEHFIDYTYRNTPRKICGIYIETHELRPSRKVRRKLRAALHQHPKSRQTRGLKEYCKLRPPKPDISDRWQRNLYEYNQIAANVDHLTRITNLDAFHKAIPEIETPIDDHYTFILTGDPVYIAGMSYFTNGWRSCMNLINGEYRAGLDFWVRLKGIGIAAIVNDRKRALFGIERRRMVKRVLVYALRNGTMAYGVMYPDSYNEYANLLYTHLAENGIIDVQQDSAHEQDVQGHTDRIPQPYLDYGYIVKTTSKKDKRDLLKLRFH